MRTLILSFHPCFAADEQIILGPRALSRTERARMRSATAVILPQGRFAELQRACERYGVRAFPDYRARLRYPGKIGQYRLFQRHALPHPETLCWSSLQVFRAALGTRGTPPHSTPFLIKANHGHEGEGIFVVERAADIPEVMEKLALRERSSESGFISQALVESGGNVLRAVVIGKRIVAYWKRSSTPAERITTISRGAAIDPVWRPDLLRKGTYWAGVFSKRSAANLAALDFVVPMAEADPEPLFLEVNYFFGRRGLGGSLRYYRLLHQAIRQWLQEAGLDPARVRRV
jgi:ribosomal protein S6--L-glutamate ligase